MADIAADVSAQFASIRTLLGPSATSPNLPPLHYHLAFHSLPRARASTARRGYASFEGQAGAVDAEAHLGLGIGASPSTPARVLPPRP